ncbi:MAG: hypothetical protein GXP40_01725 [Chloroflexi bacterium]|nr:hypothetical protein [Chloroflexota bacterium]
MRRRPIRRGFRRAGPLAVPPALKRANALMSEGNYVSAAETFESLAQRAEARRGPRAPQLYLRAGQARVLAGQTEAGMQHIRRGLSMLAARRQWAVLHRAGQRAVDELNERGLTGEAQEIADYLEKTLPEKPAPARGTTSSKRPVLPTHCPGCGGPVHPDEVEWLDNVTAECPYCGSPVRGEA